MNKQQQRKETQTITKKDVGKLPTEIVKHANQQVAVAEAIPDYLRLAPSEARPGFEEMEQQDRVLPRLALCQSNTPQRVRSNESYIDGLEDGMYFNTITRKVYGARVFVVPLLFFVSRILFPEKMGDQILCQALDGKQGTGTPGGHCLACPLSQFGTSKKPGSKAPACTKLYNYAVLAADENGVVHPDGLAVFTLKSSGAKDALNWNTLMSLRVGTAMYAGLYELFATSASDGKNSWFVPKVQNAEWVSRESYEAARLAHEAMLSMRQQGRLRHDVSDLGGAVNGAEPGEDRPPF